jgi:hypothetical protein
MKTILIAFFLINCAFISTRENRTQTPVDGVVSFFEQLGLAEITKSSNFTYNEVLEVISLVNKVISDLGNNPTASDWANMLSNFGKITDRISSTIVLVANDTELVKEVSIVSNKLNDFLRDPKKFFTDILNNVITNPINIAWACYDAYKEFQEHDYKQFGKRLANIVLLLSNGTPIPKPDTQLVFSNQYYILSKGNNLRKEVATNDCLNIVFKFITNISRKEEIMLNLKNMIEKCTK